MLTKLRNCCFLLRAAAQEYGHGDGGRGRPGYRRISGDGSNGRACLKGIAGDAKKGHFSVMAFNGSELQRFVLPLGCLTNPAFLKLLEKAEEEFGFEQEGVLTLPCHIKELQSIFHEQLDQKNHGIPKVCSQVKGPTKIGQELIESSQKMIFIDLGGSKLAQI